MFGHMRRSIRRLPDERGVLGGLEGVAFGILVFVFGTLVVVYGWAVVDAKIAATAAAREATRAFVEAPNDSSASAAAQQAAIDTLAGHGRTAISVDLNGTSRVRCGRVDVTVSTRVHHPVLPLLDSTGGWTTVSGRHSEIVDAYTSGVDGTTDCTMP
jgi:Flp pilus assembly protein TadG